MSQCFQRLVSDIMYTAPISKIQASPGLNGYVALVSGIVYLSVEVSEKLLALQSSPVLECCTYMGSDVGSRPHPVNNIWTIICMYVRCMIVGIWALNER